MNRPEIILKLALTLDGFLDDSTDDRLILSNEEDRKEVINIRDSVDAILIGGNTLRKDNPSLKATKKSLLRIVLTTSGNLPKSSALFEKDNVIVFCPKEIHEKLEKHLPSNVKIESYSSSENSLKYLVSNLTKFNVKKLLIEGGGSLSREVFQKKLFDKVRLAYAPFFLGQIGAVNAVSLVDSKKHLTERMNLISTKKLGDVVVSWYSK